MRRGAAERPARWATKPMRVTRCLFAIWAALALACEGLPAHESFAVGMSRATILERYGEPDRTSRLRKQDDRVWGPIEDFWPRVALGSTVEIWQYRTTAEWEADSGRRTRGTTEVYFVDRSPSVSGLGFAPEGVVYEGQ